MAPTHGNAFAEDVIVPAVAAVPIPSSMDYATAAAFPVAYGTSHSALVERGALRSAETLLVLGAAGGVGLTAVEVGKAMGARVIAAAGSPEKPAIASKQWCRRPINYSRESVRDRVLALTGGLGADVVFARVGGDAFDEAIHAVNWKARMLRGSRRPHSSRAAAVGGRRAEAARRPRLSASRNRSCEGAIRSRQYGGKIVLEV